MPESPDNVMEHDAEGRYIWLLVSECVPLVSEGDEKPENVIRNIERWCANGVLAPYAYKASRAQVLTLLNAGRIEGLPHKKRGLYLIHRAGLARIEDRPKPGWPQNKARQRKGRQTGASAPERVR